MLQYLHSDLLVNRPLDQPADVVACEFKAQDATNAATVMVRTEPMTLARLKEFCAAIREARKSSSSGAQFGRGAAPSNTSLSSTARAPKLDAGVAGVETTAGLPRNFEYFLVGGWALDLLNGHVSRTHDDADLIIWREHWDAFDAWLVKEYHGTFLTRKMLSDGSGKTVAYFPDGSYCEVMTMWREDGRSGPARARTKNPDTSQMENGEGEIGRDFVVVEGRLWRCRLPALALKPIRTAQLEGGTTEFPIGCRELIVRMTQEWGYHDSDKRIAKEMETKCDAALLKKIECLTK